MRQRGEALTEHPDESSEESSTLSGDLPPAPRASDESRGAVDGESPDSGDRESADPEDEAPAAGDEPGSTVGSSEEAEERTDGRGAESVPGEGTAERTAPVWTIAVSLLAVVTIGLLVLGGLMISKQRTFAKDDADRAEVTAVARDVCGKFVSVSGGNSAQTVDQLLGESTGPFRAQLTGLSKVFTTLLQQGQVQSTGLVTSVGVESIDGENANVLATATTTVKNTQLTTPTPRSYRLAVTLTRVDGRWLVSDVSTA